MKIQSVQRESVLLRAPAMRDILPSLLLFIISRGSVLGLFPFGTALFCACFDKSIGYLGITVMYLGLLSSGAGTSAIKYIIASLCFWIFTKIIPEKLQKTELFACAGAVLLGGVIHMLQTHFSVYSFILLTIEAVCALFMFEIFKKAYSYLQNPSGTPDHIELLSCAVGLGAVIIGTGSITLPYSLHPSIILAIYILLVTCLSMSSSASAAMGITTGFIAGLNSEAITLAGIMGVGSLFASILKNFKRIGIVCGFLGGICVTLLYVPQSSNVPVSFFDALAASVLFLSTPKKFLAKIPELFSVPTYDSGNVDKRASEYIQSRIASCAKAFASLGEIFEGAAQMRTELKKIHPESLFDEVCSAICVSCPRFARCYECEFDATYNMFNQIFEKIEEKGTVNLNSLPLSFRDRCLSPDKLVSEFLHRYEVARRELLHLNQMRTGSDLCATQYGEIADILDRINADVNEGFACCPELELLCANELANHSIEISSIDISENRYGKYEVVLRTSGITDMNICEKLISKVLMTNIGVDRILGDGVYHLVSKPRFCVDIGVVQESKEEVCGDSICVFTTDDHKLYCLISDGMGCGKDARTESDICATLIKEFICAGFSPETAIAMINSSLCLKSESESFATIDLCETDLITGVSQFYKIGSAISLVYDNGEVSSIYSVSLPVGMLPHLQIKPQSKQLCDGNIIMMVSDGITEAGEIKTDWLKSALKTPFDSMQELAKSVMNQALKKSGDAIKDDMSIVCVMVKCE